MLIRGKAEQRYIVDLVTMVHDAGEECGGGGPIWEEMMSHSHGNQFFGNDSLFIYGVPDGEEPTPVQQRILDLCKDYICNGYIIFNVSW